MLPGTSIEKRDQSQTELRSSVVSQGIGLRLNGVGNIAFGNIADLTGNVSITINIAGGNSTTASKEVSQ